MAPRLSTPSAAKSLAAGIDVLEVYKNNCLTSGNCNNDEDTDFETAMSAINNTSIMPAPGSGMAGNAAQEVLFIVSDGVDDSNVSGSRNQALFKTSMCTTIKNRGIRIAVCIRPICRCRPTIGTTPTSLRSSRRSPAT